MKTVTVREFYHNAGIVDGLAEGKQLVVTANGKPKFLVSKGEDDAQAGGSPRHWRPQKLAVRRGSVPRVAQEMKLCPFST
jgi:hypothetical protein